MDDELIESIMSKTTWDVMTKSEAKRYIKNGLIEKAFNVTPYARFLISNKGNLKHEFILKQPYFMAVHGEVFGPQLLCTSTFDKDGKYLETKIKKIPFFEKSSVGIVPIIRFINTRMTPDISFASKYNPEVEQNTLKYGKYLFRVLSYEESKILEDAPKEYIGSALESPLGAENNASFNDEYIIDGEYYARDAVGRWAWIRDLEWILDWDNKLLICRNIIDIMGMSHTVSDKLNYIKRQALRERKKVTEKKEYTIVSQENIMSEIIKNKYGISEGKHLERTLK